MSETGGADHAIGGAEAAAGIIDVVGAEVREEEVRSILEGLNQSRKRKTLAKTITKKDTAFR